MVYGNAIRRAQRIHLTALQGAHNILVVGGGTGAILKELLSADPAPKIFYAEASQRMLQLAAERLSYEERLRVTFFHGTDRSLPQNIRVEAIIIHFFVDMFNEKDLMPVLQRLHSILAPGGQLVCADFIDDTWWQRAMLKVMYAFFRVMTGLSNQQLAPWRKMIPLAGFEYLQSKRFWHGFIYSALYRKT